MNLPSEQPNGSQTVVLGGTQKYFAASSTNSEVTGGFNGSNRTVSPYEYLTLTGEAANQNETSNGLNMADRQGKSKRQRASGKSGASASAEHLGRDSMMRSEIDHARQEGVAEGIQEGRRAARCELEAETNAHLVRERERLNGVIREFASAREQYFTGVEQEVVRLALGIAERVLHREAQIDPLLLTRGLGREVHLEGDIIVGERSDETTQRAQYRQWARLMSAEAHRPALPPA